MSTAKHRFAAVLACLSMAALMGATLAAGHPLDVTDYDHDGYKNWADNCPNNYNPKQQDNDGDTSPAVVDQPAPHPSVGPLVVYPYTPPPPPGADPPADPPTDLPPEAGGDSCDIDDDNDGVTDTPKRDNCPRLPNPDQKDSDFDGKGDACDEQNGTPSATAATGSPDDGKAPVVSVSAPRTVRYGELGRGLAVSVRCSEACSLDGQLLVKRRAVARGAAQVAATGRTWVFLRFAKGRLARLQRKGRAAATFKLAAKDSSGNRVAVQKRLTLRR